MIAALPPAPPRTRYVRRNPGVTLAVARHLGLYPPQSGLERQMEYTLQHSGLRYAAEHWVGPYRLDFYLPVQAPHVAAPLALEVDGHSRHRTKAGRAHDARKDVYLAGQGIRVVRLPGTAVRRNPAGCLWAALRGQPLPS